VEVVNSALAMPRHVSISHESSQLQIGLSTALAFPCLRKTPCVLRSAAPLWIRPALEQLLSATSFRLKSYLNRGTSFSAQLL